MTKIRETRDTSMIDDRRGQGGGGGGFGIPGMGGGGGGGLGFPIKAGGGIIGVLVMIAVVLLPQLLGGTGTSVPGLGSPALDTGADSGAGNSADTCDDELESIICGATIDVQTFWAEEFDAAGREYPTTKTVFFTGFTRTGCGQASSQTGPFYCPADNRVYFDLDFLAQLQDDFGAQGDLASQYIVAHEYGHHVQNVLGISDQVSQAQRDDPGRANEYSVALELQADCLAGMWARDAADRDEFDSRSEISEALNAAAAVGDDRIQQQAQGRVDPDSFTHGTSEQRQQWFQRGFDTGHIDQCNTFG